MLSVARSLVSKSASRSAVAQAERAFGTFIPLTENVPGLPATTSAPAASSKVQVSTLGNGIKVAAKDDNGAVSTIAVTINAGSKYEKVFGTASLLEHLAYKSTQKRSAAKLAYDAEAIGAKFTATATRNTIVYTGTGLRGNVSDIIGTLAEVISQPKFRYYEINEEKLAYGARIAALASCPQFSVLEELYGAAFGRSSALGHNAIPTASALHDIDEGVLRGHLGSFFTSSAITVSGVNVDLSGLVAGVEGELSGVPQSSVPSPAPCAYEGGYSEKRGDGECVTIAAGFNTDGLSCAAKATLAALIGWGPDAASHNLTTAALAKPDNGFVYGVKTVSTPHLFAIVGSSAAKDAGKLVAFLASLTHAAQGASTGAIGGALAKAVVEFGTSTQSRSAAATLIGKLIASGGNGDLDAALAGYKGLSAGDVSGSAKKLFATPLALAAVGNTTFVPSYAKAAKLFQ